MADNVNYRSIAYAMFENGVIYKAQISIDPTGLLRSSRQIVVEQATAHLKERIGRQLSLLRFPEAHDKVKQLLESELTSNQLNQFREVFEQTQSIHEDEWPPARVIFVENLDDGADINERLTYFTRQAGWPAEEAA